MQFNNSDETVINNIIIKVEHANSLNNANLNGLIDELNSFSYRSALKVPKDKLDVLLRNICESIPPQNCLLIAKCCQLVLNLCNKQTLELSKKTLDIYVERLSNVLLSSADVCFIDILLLLRVLVLKHSHYFSEEGSKLLLVLLSDIESRSSLVEPGDVKLLRLQCLSVLVSVLPFEETKILADNFLLILYTHPTSDLLLHAKIWSCVLSALDKVVIKDKDWLDKEIQRLLGCVLCGLHLGMAGTIPQLPTSVYPSPLPDLPSDTSARNPMKNKNWKQKMKPVDWSDGRPTEDESAFDWSTISNVLTSDSDFSDSETGRLIKEQARARLSAANLLINIVKVCQRKVLSGYYSMLLGPRGLQDCIRNDSSHHPRLASITASRALLTTAKSYLALAQHCESGAFTPYAELLSELLVSWHKTLSTSLLVPCQTTEAPLLQCLSTLISVTPYHRLSPELFTLPLVTSLRHISSKKANTVVGVLQCINALLTLDPMTQEVKEFLKKGPSGKENFWIISFCLKHIEIEEWNEAVRVGWWQIITALFNRHFELAVSAVPQFMDYLLVDICANTYKSSQVHAFQALISLLEQLASKDEYKVVCSTVWKKLLQEGHLISHLQDPTTIAALACDCLKEITHTSFYDLNEKTQILVMTLLFGCCSHEENTVRASALRALGLFLAFPQMINEPFIYDITHILLQAVHDPCSQCRCRASWSLGNLAGLLKENDEEFVQEVSLIKLIDACLNLSNDGGNTKANVARGLGCLLALLSEDDMEDPRYRQALDKSTNFLIKSTTSGIFMKLRWNACYAIGNILKNDNLYKHSSWFEDVVRSLCSLLTKCNHFKVRVNAAAALCSIRKRSHFSKLYLFVWQSLLDGLDNSANMPDFREFKHQHDLLHQLCTTICHVINLLGEEDLNGLADLLEYRQDSFQNYMHRFFASVPPEQSSLGVEALHHVCSLKVGHQQPCIALLIEALTPETSSVV